MTYTTTPTMGAGAKLTAAYLAILKGNFDELADAWTAYSPVVSGTGWVVGNATLTGSWISFGKFALGSFSITIGSTTTVGTGAYSITVPATASTTNIGAGTITVFDTSASAIRQRNLYLNTTTTVAAQDEAGAFVTGAAPFALASGDTLKGQFFFQVA